MRFELFFLVLVAASCGAAASSHLRRESAQPTQATQKCDDSSFNGTFDLVITWHTDSYQSSPETPADLKHLDHLLRGESEFLQEGATFENQREIMYLLRGAEKFGILNKTRMVYVVVAKGELESVGPPRDLNWEHPQLRLVSDDEIGVTGMGGYTSKFASLQNIPGIGEWIMLLQDDNFPTGKWDPSGVYDYRAHKPVVRLGVDGFRQGWCGEGKTQSPMEHGPWFVNRCHLQELESRYPDRYKKVRHAKKKKDTYALDMQCLYDNTAASEGWSVPTSNTGFWTNCHINAPCPGEFCCREDTFTNPQTMFMNLQGPGVSDDYPEKKDIHLAAKKWFHEEFSRPSRFEKSVIEPLTDNA